MIKVRGFSAFLVGDALLRFGRLFKLKITKSRKKIKTNFFDLVVVLFMIR